MKPFLLLLLNIVCLHLIGFSQTSDNKSERPFEFYFDMGWVVGPSTPGAQLDYFISVDYTPGIRWKHQLSNKLELLGELSYHNVHYHLHQETAKLLPNAIVHDRERFYIHVLNLAPVVRYHLPISDWFMDLGVNIDYNFRRSHMTKNPDSDGNPVKVFDRSITYFEPFNTDVLVRLGRGRWTLHGIYRLTNLLKEESGLPGLPPTIIGLGLSI